MVGSIPPLLISTPISVNLKEDIPLAIRRHIVQTLLHGVGTSVHLVSLQEMERQLEAACLALAGKQDGRPCANDPTLWMMLFQKLFGSGWGLAQTPPLGEDWRQWFRSAVTALKVIPRDREREHLVSTLREPRPPLQGRRHPHISLNFQISEVCHQRLATKQAVTLIRLLLVRGAHVNCRIAMRAAAEQLTPLSRALHNADLVEFLLNNGADPSFRLEDRGTLLHKLVCDHSSHATTTNNALRIVDLLIKRDVAINEVDDDGKTALYLSSHLGNEILVRDLLGRNADPNVETRDRKTALSRVEEILELTVLEQHFRERMLRIKALLSLKLEEQHPG